jgi:hypothetical protein
MAESEHTGRDAFPRRYVFTVIMARRSKCWGGVNAGHPEPRRRRGTSQLQIGLSNIEVAKTWRRRAELDATALLDASTSVLRTAVACVSQSALVRSLGVLSLPRDDTRHTFAISRTLTTPNTYPGCPTISFVRGCDHNRRTPRKGVPT